MAPAEDAGVGGTCEEDVPSESEPEPEPSSSLSRP